MNPTTSNWKKFYLHDIFTIDMGSKLDDNKMSHEKPCINFVSRTSNNNGVSDVVDLIEGLEPYSENLITIALGGSLGSCFLQTKPFYTGQNVCVLAEKEKLSIQVKLFLTEIIMFECQVKYTPFGRELNRHIRKDFELFLPICYEEDGATPRMDDSCTYSKEGYIPDFKYMEDYIKGLKYKPLTTEKAVTNTPVLSETNRWKEFKVHRLFKLVHGKANDGLLEDGTDCIYLGAKRNDCGFMRYCKFDAKLTHTGNCVVFITNGQGSVGYAFYKNDEPFIATIDLVMGYANFLTPAIGNFIAAVLCKERPKYSHGRKWKKTLQNTIIKLPVCYKDDSTPVIDPTCKYSDEGYIPDFDYMENYIKGLPYGDRI